MNEVHIETNSRNTLKAKLADVDMKKVFTAEKIQEAQSVFDDAAEKFRQEASVQVNELHRLCCEAESDSAIIQERVQSIHKLSYQLRGRLEALGMIFLYDICDSLYRYTRGLKQYDKITLTVVAKHIHAMQAALRESHASDGGASGKQMIDMLQQLISKLRAA